MKYENLLPAGSVVRIGNGPDLLMIMGCNQVDMGTGKLYDYSGVAYPSGYTDERHVFIFNHEDIGQVYSVGYLTKESTAYAAAALEENGKLKDGTMTIQEYLGDMNRFK